MRQLWYETHLLDSEAGKTARRRGIALGASIHEKILAIGDRLARESALLAQRFYCRAPDAYAAFGGDFDRWVSVGERLATGELPLREAAVAYFEINIAVAAELGLDTLDRWVRIATALARTSRKLATTFCESTAPLLGRVTLAQLDAWTAVARQLYAQHGWHGEFLAQAYLNAAPHALLALQVEQYALWADLGARLRRIIKEAEFFGALSPTVRRWPDTDRTAWLRCGVKIAASAPNAAAAWYRDAPRAVRRLPAARRAQLLAALDTAGAALAEHIDDLVPVLGAVVLDIPAKSRSHALALAQRVADVFARATASTLRSLPKAYEESSAEGVANWVERGLAIARDNGDAGVAYFALESRTSLKILRAASTGVALEEVQGVLRKLIQMLSGESASIHTVDGGFTVRPPLEEFPAECEVALPLRIDCLATHEDNARLYRVMAAWLAGRREFGTYDFDPDPDGGDASGAALVAYLRQEERPDLLEQIFLVTDGYRVARRVVADYPGLAEEFRWAASRMLDYWAARYAQVPDGGTLLDATLALALSAPDGGTLPEWLAAVAPVIVPCLAPLGAPTATAADALRVAQELTDRLLDPTAPRRVRQDQFEFGGLILDQITGETLIDPYDDDDTPLPLAAEAPRVPAASGHEPEAKLPDDMRFELDPSPDDLPAGAQPLSLDELRRLLEQGADLKIKQGTGEETDGIGLFITDLIGKIPSEQIEELRRLLGDTERSPRNVRRWLEDRTGGPSFLYDEWDYHISDYRPRWCRLREVTLASDGGEFFNDALSEYAAMIPEVRQQFQRIRPEMYRVVRGLEDGEDFDLNAAVTARVEFRARRSPSSKLYVARKREERDVATLFLLDMSASTDEPLEKPPQSPGDDDQDLPRAMRGRAAPPTARRIIDVTKEALVIMAEALEEIGDAYAIYGFSGQGRGNVEFYLVKSFAEQLSSAVKGRIGGIEPKRSTRMGTALRHAIEKMNAVNSRSKHLILLSDGFPQDFDYGQDRRSNVYGIRDTTVALRETEAAGITPFCITVDRAGHDYLRQMCDESRYMVIEDIATLPKELPKIYQRVVTS
ncbi:MAG TPA: VWA domain-containing protein [Candidatus Kryptonia bacterium]|nr:VWA domain-containing protein [Candidatus Kryptonia bacterium]